MSVLLSAPKGCGLGWKASLPASVCPCRGPDSVSFVSVADGGDQSVIMETNACSPSEGSLLSSSAGSELTHLSDSDKLSRSFPWGNRSRKSRLSGLSQRGASLPGEHGIVRLSSHEAFGQFQIFLFPYLKCRGDSNKYLPGCTCSVST